MPAPEDHVVILGKVAAAWEQAMKVPGGGSQVSVAVCDAKGKIAADTRFFSQAQAEHFFNSLSALGFTRLKDTNAIRGYDVLLGNQNFVRE